MDRGRGRAARVLGEMLLVIEPELMSLNPGESAQAGV